MRGVLPRSFRPLRTPPRSKVVERSRRAVGDLSSAALSFRGKRPSPVRYSVMETENLIFRILPMIGFGIPEEEIASNFKGEFSPEEVWLAYRAALLLFRYRGLEGAV